ncbi:MAG: cytoplasmic protein [Alphaproteobacteria bacterium]|nr:MAG: cytoplasmic protein [Alphaproteobacteria bacterium]
MMLLNALMGNANSVDPKSVANDLANILIPGERVEHAYKLVRDLIVFTDKRLLFVDKQGMTGKKTTFQSLPYSKITHFSVETAGTLDMEAEMKIGVSGGTLFSKTFGRGVDITEVQRVLATYVLV